MMPNVLDLLSELLPHRRVREASLPAGQEDLYWAVSALLSPGNCYFFVLELPDATLRYVHPA
ncbi:MAG: hypothetical protein ACR2K1_09710, partial [Saprospiraceae bacterium]